MASPGARHQLRDIAHRTMLERGFEPDFSPPALAEMSAIHETPLSSDDSPLLRDLRELLWASIDNDDSRDLDQLTVTSRVGERFESIVTGASPKGTWVRIARPAVEGRVVRGFEGLDGGYRTTVELASANVDRSFIDFVRVERSS